MRIFSARMTSTALGLSLAALAAYVAFSAGGCTVTTSDDTLDGGDTGVINQDTGQPPLDTGTPDTTPTDTGSGTAVVIKAQLLVGGLCDGTACDIRDFGGGSAKTDIIPTDPGEGQLIWDAYATVTTASGTVTSNEIKGTSTTSYVDGRLTGLQAGTPVTITVTGYLRGLMGDGPDKGNIQIPWATATCTATPSDTTDVQATCTRTTSAGAVACTNGCLTLIPTLKGILFTNDVLQSGYCSGKGATDFSLFRARLPFTGVAAVSRNEQDCGGVIWVPADGSWSEESPGVSNWGLSLEPLGASEPACSLSNPCKIDRNKTPGACATAGSPDCLDVYVVGSECQMTNTSTGGTCF
jgi:hypothetical protein